MSVVRRLTVMVAMVAIVLLVVGCVGSPSTLVAPPLPGYERGLALTDIYGVNYVRTTEDDPDLCPDLHYEADVNCPWDMAVIERDLDALRERGVNTIRIFLNYYVFGAARLTNPDYSPDVAYAHLDDLIAAANERGIYVMPILLSKYPQYRFDAASYGTALDVHVRPVVARYADHPGIIAWDVFNEPDIGSPIDIRCWDWDNADHAACLPLAEERLAFLQVVTDEVRRLDPDTPVTISMAFAKSFFAPEEAPLHAAAMVDFFAFHYYDNDPYDSGRYQQHWYYGQGFPADLEHAVGELHALDPTKPVVLTEIGFPTGAGALRSAAEMRRDMIIAMRYIDGACNCGVMVWPFQNDARADLGGLYP